ncbi:MAG: hypothetical protein JST33_14495 [Actinobacteria bacterium]|nr:hypothetical protein [Actinomycetota bacterium]
MAASVGLAGCAPSSAPKPTPTPLFTSEAEAFKAAEQVYRDYIDALNARNDGDGKREPEQYLAGKALENYVKSARDRDAEHVTLEGHTTITAFSEQSASISIDATKVIATVCIDISETRVIGADGANMTPADRPSKAGFELTFSQTKSRLLILESKGMKDPKC